MDKQSLIKKILGRKEVKDYTYAFIFFVLSSFFALFAIRPALSIAFSLKREAFDLDHVNTLYENNLTKLVGLQSSLEQVRDRIYLLDKASPEMPETKTLIDNIKQSASQEGMLIKKLTLAQVDLKNSTNTGSLQKLSVSMETTSSYTAINGFMHRILNLRRLTTIPVLKISTDDSISSTSGTLRVTMEIEGYYL